MWRCCIPGVTSLTCASKITGLGLCLPGKMRFLRSYLLNPGTGSALTIAAHYDGVAPVYSDITASSQAILKLKLPAKKRGWLVAPRISFFTEFPLSLFHVWAYANLDMRCLVYPHPAPAGLPVPSSPDQGSTGAIDASSGDDDFAGHRNYQFGDSPRRVDWKASSREQGLLTKQFQGEAASAIWFDWAQTPGVDAESRIRQLAPLDRRRTHGPQDLWPCGCPNRNSPRITAKRIITCACRHWH